MTQKHKLTAFAIVAVTALVSYSQSLAEAGQGNGITHLSGMMAKATSVNDEPQRKSLIHKVGTDAYSGIGTPSMSPPATPTPTPQGAVPGNQSRSTGDYKFGSPSNDGRYGSSPSNPSDNYFKKESSGASTGPYGGSVYGGLPSTPSADPMIKDLSR